ncbi:MAG: DMT family transporter [Bacteroidales bacterium]|nr:DMT family transporter [Bacteroidales bacterium]
MKKSNTSSLLQAHLAVLLFGLAGVIGRGVASPAFVVTFARVLFSSITLGLFFLLRRQSIRLRRPGDFAMLALAGVIMAAHWTMFMASIQKAGVAVGTITFATFPLFVTFLEPLMFHEKLKPGGIVQALIMLIGVVVLAPLGKPDPGLLYGILLGMGSSLTYAMLSLLNRRFTADYSSSQVCFYEQGVATIVLLPIMFILRPEVIAADIPYLIVLGIVCTAIAHSLFIASFAGLKVRTAGIISGMETVYSIILASLILAELPSMREIIGGVIILGVVMYSTLKSGE